MQLHSFSLYLGISIEPWDSLVGMVWIVVSHTSSEHDHSFYERNTLNTMNNDVSELALPCSFKQASSQAPCYSACQVI